MSSEPIDDAALVHAARSGDGDAFTALFRAWFNRCYDIALRIVHDEGKAADVAQDTFFVAWRQLDDLRDPAAFGGWVSRMARNRALNRLEREGRDVAVDAATPVFAELEATSDVERDVTRLEQEQMLRASSATLGERDASVLDLHLRHGMSVPEIAEELGVETNNAHQLLFRMKKRLATGIRAYVLFRGGDPACIDLRATLAAAGIERFAAETAQIIGQHVKRCDECEQRQSAVLSPEAMFSAVPIAIAPATLRTQAADALRAAGVPLSSDAGEPLTDGPDAAGQGSTSVPGAAMAGGAAGSMVEIATGGGARRRAVLVALTVLVTLIAAGTGAALRGGDSDGGVAAGQSSEVSAATTTKLPATSTSPTTTTSSTTTTSTITTTSVAAAPPAGPTPRFAPPQNQPAPPAPPPPPPLPPPPPPPPLPTTTIAPPPPTVDAFTAVPVGAQGSCAVGEWATTLTWSTTGATSVSISDGMSVVNGGADGIATGCRVTAAPPPSGWTVTATGPGGQAQANAGA